MKLREILSLLEQISRSSGISTPFICGGTPRDRYLGLVKDGIADLDITTGDESIHHLAKLFSMELSKQFKITSKKAEDGHTSIHIGDFKIDFSSNFVNDGIDQLLLKQHNIKSPTNLQREMFSRDFTCNALLMTTDLKTIKDPTKLGLVDINKRIIRTCLDPNTTLSSNPNRIIRVIYLAAKLDFDVDPIIIKWLSEHKQLIKLSSDNYLIKNIDKAMARNPERAVDIINKTNLWDFLPITEELKPYHAKRSISKSAQLRRNFDLGEGLYSNLDKYKSVSDFRKKRRKKRMKEIKRIKDMVFK